MIYRKTSLQKVENDTCPSSRLNETCPGGGREPGSRDFKNFWMPVEDPVISGDQVPAVNHGTGPGEHGIFDRHDDFRTFCETIKEGGLKEMADDCCAPGGNVMILSCSGGSNVGQLANQAAVELTQEGFGKIYCLAGVGGLLSGFVQSAKDASEMVAIDGCSIGCAKAILDKADVPLKGYVVLTDMGIEKNKDFNLQQKDVHRVKEAVKQAVKPGQPFESTAERGSGRCCG